MVNLIPVEISESADARRSLNGEITRRTDVIDIFLNEDAITGVIDAILIEQNDKWASSARYMTLEASAS